MSKQMHSVLVQSAKYELDRSFQDIKTIFEKVPEYKQFYERLQHSFSSNIEGFEHKLEIDLSAYDPNNYFNALRIIAKENGSVRSFNEFGTGEQQILLMAFIKAYAETFKGEYFVLGIEEPEAHLHPLAQKWLAKNIENLCKNGVQTIITTHSPEFLNIENLEGFIRVYKEDGVTKVVQHNAKSLSEKCIELGANPDKTTEETILKFYRTNTFYDQLKGFFARKVILVEGSTEMFSLANYFLNMGYDLIKEGVEIVDCRGKSQIARNYRLFTTYGYDCFCLFDADASDDEKKRANEELSKIFKFDTQDMITDEAMFTTKNTKAYGYFGKDYESYLRKNVERYKEKEAEISGSKVLIAKIISEDNKDYKPPFIEAIAIFLNLYKLTQSKDELGIKVNEEVPDLINQKNSDDIPF
jgi:putative ATP-dependent endonuclease of OLD family